MSEANRTFMRFQWRAHKVLWNASGGRLGRKVGGLPTLELVTTGRKSGEQRQILITYFDHEGSPVLVGTNAGRDADPAWVLNLRADPNARRAGMAPGEMSPPESSLQQSTTRCGRQPSKPVPRTPSTRSR